MERPLLLTLALVASLLCVACGSTSTEALRPSVSVPEESSGLEVGSSSGGASTLSGEQAKSPLDTSPPLLSSEGHDSEGRGASPAPIAAAYFPPTSPGPAHSRSAHDGDGVWGPFFELSAGPDGKGRMESALPEGYEEGLVRRMVLHPHVASRFQTLVLAAFDLGQLLPHHRPGAQDVKDVGRSELSDRAGLVPPEDRAALFAVFNGGFQPRHGRWGMLSLGQELIPPRDDACTVAILRDGSMRIAPWPTLADIRDQIVVYRQTPPCLIEDGEIHPRLLRKDRAPWAGQNEKRKTRRRSSVALGADGKILLFAVGEETEPETLAAGLLHAGAEHAAQLDINWNWTRLFLYNNSVQPVRSVGALEKDMAKDKGEYLSRPAKRGFFYLTRR